MTAILTTTITWLAGKMPLWIWCALAAIALLLAAYFTGQHHGAKNTDTAWQTKWNEREAGLMKAQADAEAAQRAEETRRATEITEVKNEANKQITKALSDAANANAAAGRLRDAANQLASGGSQTSDNPAPAGGSPPAAAPAVVLSDVFLRADAAAGELAESLDRAYIAGTTCERSYDALTRESQ